MNRDYVVIDGLRYRAIKPFTERWQKGAQLVRTLGGVDFQMGKMYRVLSYTLRVRHIEEYVAYGSFQQLRDTYAKNEPITVEDWYGNVYTAVIINDATLEPLATVVYGECAYFLVRLTLVLLEEQTQ